MRDEQLETPENKKQCFKLKQFNCSFFSHSLYMNVIIVQTIYTFVINTFPISFLLRYLPGQTDPS